MEDGKECELIEEELAYISNAAENHDQLVDTITEQEKVISELYKQLDHCHSWLKIHADYHGSPLCINTDKILAKHKQSKGE